jgi:hypothetical protein
MLVVLLLLVSLLVGCASPNFVIYPAGNQGQDVEKIVRGGYTFLRSEKGESVATVSLRRATETYVQAYVSISNQGASSASIDPGAMTVTNQGGKSMAAYPPEEAPRVVQRVAGRSYDSFTRLNTLGGTGNTVMGAKRGESSRGSYGSGSEDGRSYLDLMLREQTLPAKQASSGLVFAPFSTGINTFQMTVPVGNTTHTFRFSVQKEK